MPSLILLQKVTRNKLTHAQETTDIVSQSTWQDQITFTAPSESWTLRLWMDPKKNQSLCEIDGRLVQSISKDAGATAQLQITLQLPSPLPRGGSLYQHDLTLLLQRKAFLGNWKLECPGKQWLEQDAASAAIGDLDGWLELPTLLHSDVRPRSFSFPAGAKGLGVFNAAEEQLPWMVDTAGNSDFKGQMGILRLPPVEQAEPSELVLIFNPRGLSNVHKSGDTYTSPPLLKSELRFMAKVVRGNSANVYTQAPLILCHSLAPVQRARTWSIVTQWRGYANGDQSKDLDFTPVSFKSLVDNTWNDVVSQLANGGRATEHALSWLPLPVITVKDEKTQALVCLERNPQTGITRATNLAASLGAPGTTNLSLAFERLGLTLGGTLQKHAVLPAWFDKLSEQNLPVDSITRTEMNVLWPARTASAGDASLIADWSVKVDTVTVTQSPIVIGSMEFCFRPEGNVQASATCRLRGNWTISQRDLYPEFELTIACRIRPSGAADIPGSETGAQFDTISELEDTLQRSSGPVISHNSGLDAWRKASLRLRYKTQAGREAVTEMVLSSSEGDRNFGDAALYLQLRPFMVACMRPIEFDEQAGGRIAEWRSDDADGPQWRFPDATVEVQLPPQAVGEEMERGRRFWDPATPDTSYIRADRPLRYRFSPPTRLVVSPAVNQPRRYNTSPYNMLSVLHYAKVQQFTTEIAYPVQTTFQVNLEGAPDIRIAETEYFIGKPVPNLPIFDTDNQQRLLPNLFDGDLSAWALGLSAATIERFRLDYNMLRQRQSAVRMNFVARLAEHHLYDPWRRDRKLMLSEGLESMLRGTAEGAPPLAKVLGDGADLQPRDKIVIKGFLDPATIDWRALADGTLCAGVLFTVESGAELLALLRNPRATSTVIDHLSFTAMGANAHLAVSFDEGRTTFTVDVREGQVTRLAKTRIGRIALLWNQAKHVVVYQRDIAPSEPLMDEQAADPKLGWPMLRKWDEYVEPVERIRQFDNDHQKASHVAGFVEGAEFITQRIQVSGAWSRDLREQGALSGYELPLWNALDTSGFYPKPTVSLRVHTGETDIGRLPCRDPQHLYFYSNTEANGGNNPDLWPAIDGVDGDTRCPRLPPLHQPKNHIGDLAIPSPREQGFSRPRFDLAVLPLAAANIQHGRGREQMLTRLDVVSLSRTASTDTPLLTTLAAALTTPRDLAQKASEVALIKDKMERLLSRLPEMALQIHLDCDILKQRMRDELEKGFGELANGLAALPTVQINPQAIANVAAGACQRLRASMVDSLRAQLAAPVGALEDLDRALMQSVDDALALDDNALQRSCIGIASALRPQLHAMSVIVERAVADMDRLRANVSPSVYGAINASATTVAASIQQAAALLATWTYLDEGPLDQLRAEALGKLDDAAAKIAAARTTITNLAGAPVGDTSGIAQPAMQLVIGLLHTADASLGDLGQRLQTVRGKVAASTALDRLQRMLDDAFLTANTSITAGLQQAIAFTAKATETLQQLANNMFAEITRKTDTVAEDASQLLVSLEDMETRLKAIASGADLRPLLVLLKAELAFGLASSGRKLQTLVQDYAETLLTPITKDDGVLDALVATLTRLAMDGALAINRVTEAVEASTLQLSAWLKERYLQARELIDNIDCAKIASIAAELHKTIAAAVASIEQKVTGVLASMLDDATRHEFEQALASGATTAAQLGAGIKLVKAIGSLPALPTLTFNADRAEYVFDDFKKQIQTSPFVARLHEIGDGLQDLGLSIPSSALLDQVIPDGLDKLKFSEVFNKVAGMDFADFFKRFSLPQINEENIKIVHGFDAATRSAWVKSTVNTHFPAKQELLSFGSLIINLEAIVIDARSDIRIDAGGLRQADTDAKFKADWLLEFSGSELAAFRQVTVSYDGSHFDFDVSPANIDLHPALKFVSDFARRFGDNIPPAIELERDGRGMPVGARTNIVTVISDLPPLGPVTIGALRVATGLGLRVSEQGRFIVSTHLAVGSKAQPVFVQISYLGGGMWLEAQAMANGSDITYGASIGLALGSTRALNIGSIARGYYSIMLFVSAEVSNSGGTLRAGLSMEGCARIMGVCNASLSLLLEAVHSSNGGTTGHGELHVEVKICWCYTLKVHRSVTQNI